MLADNPTLGYCLRCVVDACTVKNAKLGYTCGVWVGSGRAVDALVVGLEALLLPFPICGAVTEVIFFGTFGVTLSGWGVLKSTSRGIPCLPRSMSVSALFWKISDTLKSGAHCLEDAALAVVGSTAVRRSRLQSLQ